MRGGFYANFKSKEDLVAESCGRTLTELVEGWDKVAGEAKGRPFESHCGWLSFRQSP